MARKPAPTLHRLTVGGEVFVCGLPPVALSDRSVEAALAAALSAQPEIPGLLYWDGRLSGGEGETWVRFGHGALDPLLAGELDLSGCVAIREQTLSRLAERGAKGVPSFARSIALLARSPGVKSRWCDGVAGIIDGAEPGPLSHSAGPPGSAEDVSLIALVLDPSAPVEPFFAALKAQTLAGSLDVVVATLGLQSQQLKALAKTLAACASEDSRLKIRRYSFTSGLTPAYLANIAVGLSVSEAIVLADIRCVPRLPHTVQRLADWSVSGEAVAACPRILGGDRLLAAGLALKRSGGEDTLASWNDPMLSDRLRTAAAPAPWFFGLRRSAWLAAQGLRDSGRNPLWTAGFAAADGPAGRTVLVGSEVAEWIGSEPPASPDTAAAVVSPLQPYPGAALREPVASDAPVVMPAPKERVRAAVEGPRQDDGGVAVFTDPFPSRAETRILVVADSFAASQSIAFVQGLSGARDRGAVAVRIIEEAAFAGDSRSLDEQDATGLIEAQMEETQPTVVVASRLGHAGAWRALHSAARARGVPVMVHLDDGLIDLPAVLGIERYRLGRNAKRVQTLRDSLAKADMILAATPTLAQIIADEVGGSRIAAMESGAAARPPVPRISSPERSATGRLVVGYMGSASHDHDLAMVVPALNRIAEDHPHVQILLFGSIAEQPSTKLLKPPVEKHEAIRDYAAFRRRLAELSLDIGLAPLRDNAFNRAKTPTKWVEYAEAGVPTLVSRVTPYLPIVEAGASLAVRPDQWETALRRLIADRPLRLDLVERADRLLLERFGWDRVERDVLAAVRRVSNLRRDAA